MFRAAKAAAQDDSPTPLQAEARHAELPRTFVSLTAALSRHAQHEAHAFAPRA
jgi:hypothetical protein